MWSSEVSGSGFCSKRGQQTKSKLLLLTGFVGRLTAVRDVIATGSDVITAGLQGGTGIPCLTGGDANPAGLKTGLTWSLDIILLIEGKVVARAEGLVGELLVAMAVASMAAKREAAVNLNSSLVFFGFGLAKVEAFIELACSTSVSDTGPETGESVLDALLELVSTVLSRSSRAWT